MAILKKYFKIKIEINENQVKERKRKMIGEKERLVDRINFQGEINFFLGNALKFKTPILVQPLDSPTLQSLILPGSKFLYR